MLNDHLHDQLDHSRLLGQMPAHGFEPAVLAPYWVWSGRASSRVPTGLVKPRRRRNVRLFHRKLATNLAHGVVMKLGLPGDRCVGLRGIALDQLAGDRFALFRREVPAMQILRDHKGERVAAVVFAEPRLDPRQIAGLEAISTVEHHALREDDRLAQPVLGNIVGKFEQLGIRQDREQPGDRVRFSQGIATIPTLR